MLEINFFSAVRSKVPNNLSKEEITSGASVNSTLNFEVVASLPQYTVSVMSALSGRLGLYHAGTCSWNCSGCIISVVVSDADP